MMFSLKLWARYWAIMRIAFKSWCMTSASKSQAYNTIDSVPQQKIVLPILSQKQDTPPSLVHTTEQDGDFKRGHSIHEVITALGVLKGPIVKIAQMLGMIPGLLPSDFSNALLTLCTDATAMHPSLLVRKIQIELGQNWKNQFIYFDKHPVASASLGQIHKGELLDGTHVAIKIQYPGMKQAVQGDLALFKILLQRWGSSENALDMRDFPTEWEHRLFEELDYTYEIRNMQRWGVLFHHHPHIHIPKPVPHLSTAQILTMTWLQGECIQSAFDQDQDVRNDLGKKIFRAWYFPFYHAGMLHGDPHIGNIAWSVENAPLLPVMSCPFNQPSISEKNHHVYIFDFGCVRIFPPLFVQAFCHLYQGLLDNNSELTQQAYTEFGFTDLKKPVIAALNSWAHFLLAPFLIDQECALEEISCPKQAIDAMKHLENIIKEHGGARIPPEFLIFDRVAVILGSLFIRLQVRANWHQLMHEFIKSFCLQKCITNQKQLLDI